MFLYIIKKTFLFGSSIILSNGNEEIIVVGSAKYLTTFKNQLKQLGYKIYKDDKKLLANRVQQQQAILFI